MGWVNDRFDNHASIAMALGAEGAAESSFEAKAEDQWKELVAGFQRDVEEYRSRDGSADFDQAGERECRISSTASRTNVGVTMDLSAHTIHYIYEPGDLDVAVPEQGVLTLRPAGSSVEIYSADQRLSPDEARRMILEPLLFPLTALEDTGT
jgi:hypothetical protein